MSYSLLLKAENALAYKALANKGIMVGHGVSFNGQDKRPDIGTKYHVTVKASDSGLTTPSEMHAAAQKADFPAIDPKTTGIEPGVFKDRNGNDVYMIKLHPADDSLKQANSKFEHIKQFRNFDFTPHVSVDSDTWHKIKSSGAKTAHEAGMEFGPAKLHAGDKELATYHPKKIKEEKLAASEVSELEPLEKGLKHLATAASMAATLGINAISPGLKAPDPSHHYDHDRMLSSISQVESSGGKFVNHRQLSGPIHSGESAIGAFGLTPDMIRETLKINPDLKKEHGKAISLHGEDMKRYMQDNPNLNRTIASKHLERLEHHFGNDPAKIGMAWLDGITGTNKAINKGAVPAEHWHARKILDAYKKVK